MTAADDTRERSHQGIANWAEHGVQQYEEREAAERAEMGEPEEGEPSATDRGSRVARSPDRP
jgi:hypothetical protein